VAKHLQRELERLKKRILALGAMVEERVRIAIRAVEMEDRDLADKVIKNDFEVDEFEVEIEEECLKLLALHQPVAVDLRFLIVVIKLNNDLERIGDEAVNIAKCLSYMEGNEDLDFPSDYVAMAEKAESMLTKSLDALVNLDLDLAFRVLTLDDDVDHMNAAVHSYVKKAIQDDPSHANAMINFLLIARHLERIADHATNIAEEVIYMIEGEIVRHGRWESP
jgi:phosphate transport system protein